MRFLRLPPARGPFRPRAARRVAVLAAVVALPLAFGSACTHAFNAAKFANASDLYRASVQRFDRRKWDDALAGFDRLATQLPARDTLLPRVYYYQGRAHARKGDHLLAAQAYARIGDAFPDDSLAPDALYEQGHEYQMLWRRPSLDPQYGETALATYRQLVQLYPESRRVADANRQIAALQQQFATKDFNTGMDYVRRRAYDSALIYFKDVVRLYPGTPAARGAYLQMIAAYRALKYQEEIAETCADMRRTYPGDGDVRRTCGAPPVSVAPATPPPAAPPVAPAAAAPSAAAPSASAPSPPSAPPPAG